VLIVPPPPPSADMAKEVLSRLTEPMFNTRHYEVP
jgi:hypothetical protein